MMKSDMNTPILFIVFNRIDTVVQVFERVRDAKPKKLYIAADGPRDHIKNEEIKTSEIRDYILKNINWDCEVKTLFREKNVGCKEAVGGAISWMFESEESGIILEDDCLPHPDFFSFCENMLEKYKNDSNIGTITGNNFQNGIKRGDSSYYFSKYNHVWGWATWKRAWKEYSGDLPFLDEWLDSREWKEMNSNFFERRYWERIFTKVKSGEIATAWDYPWTGSLWYCNMLTITPNVNLVSNIGFGKDSTHTNDVNSPFNNILAISIGDIIHPKKIQLDIQADVYTYRKVFGGEKFTFPNIFMTFIIYIVNFFYKKEAIHEN